MEDEEDHQEKGEKGERREKGEKGNGGESGKKKWGKLKDLRRPNVPKILLKKGSERSPPPPSHNGDASSSQPPDADPGSPTRQQRGGSVANGGSPYHDTGKTTRGKRPKRFNEKSFSAILETVRTNSFRNSTLDMSHKYLDKYAAEDLHHALVLHNPLSTIFLPHFIFISILSFVAIVFCCVGLVILSSRVFVSFLFFSLCRPLH